MAISVLSTAQTGNGDSAVAERSDRYRGYPAAISITTTVGATPTVTVNILGSIDRVNFYNIPYALVATPGTFVQSALTITTATTTSYLLQRDQAWRWVKINLSANTNVTVTASAFM